ncbi:hypothetical protein AKJ52_02380 [candidate division MSBL1 archaeon SCGC-AAA382C18]|uniref:Glutamate dehydrogenase n=1 Tax=candidate division MSBL1 archaeon SCGC-AAA382C18 TaxID=1698281 RepID=A0A133VII9_9EURY|nr:hypothetical protein AKJ52_02380 [candidate division MSBL1 archaeon SCGC-AAA382C18]
MLINQKVRDYVGLSDKAIEILERPDREIRFHLRKHTPEGIIGCFLVYHNTARGPPCKGGIRLSKNVSMEETEELAEIMTYKNSLMGLPFGGGKSGIAASSGLSPKEKETIIQGFTHEIREELYSGAYVPAPDIGTGPRQMAEIFDETHVQSSVTGKPIGIGGLPGRREATGYGVSVATDYVTKEILEDDLKDLDVAIQGYGNVGFWTSKFLSDKGANIIAVTDAGGGTKNPDGLDVDELKQYEQENGTVNNFDDRKITNEELFSLDVDILIPAAIGGVITKEVAEKIKADLIVEAANAPTTEEGIKILDERGIPTVPDMAANAGGVIASYVEWRGGKSGSKTQQSETYQSIQKNITEALTRTLKIKNKEEKLNLRDSAMVVSTKTLKETMEDRGWI